MMDEWESLFSPRILVRGMDYYESGAVMEMVRTEGGYRALVEGTEDYEVEIDIKDNQVQHMRCTCPYAAEGYNCKHMAAVLYEAEEGGVLEMSPTADGGTVQDSRQELKDVINGIPEEELRRLLESMAWEDGKLRNKILIQYSSSISQRQMAMLKREINDIAYGYSDRYGYVDWENAGNYLLEMEAFLNDKVQAVINKGCWMQAFELTNQVFITIGNQDIDDSGGGLGMVAEACYEFWKQILEKCSEQDKDRMRAWFKKYQADGIVTDYLEEYISGFLMNELHDRELLQRTMETLDQEIEKNREGMDCGKYYSVQYGFEYNILKRLQIMKELGASEEEDITVPGGKPQIYGGEDAGDRRIYPGGTIQGCNPCPEGEQGTGPWIPLLGQRAQPETA
ncbi:MAG: SWIM zinc finger family protein [Clostridiales bacterium]|nr:SWIM zinc finger family protein [Clostridiales bacterium]